MFVVLDVWKKYNRPGYKLSKHLYINPLFASAVIILIFLEAQLLCDYIDVTDSLTGRYTFFALPVAFF